jgi:hypothetical protein
MKRCFAKNRYLLAQARNLERRLTAITSIAALTGTVSGTILETIGFP